jgi:hypothetical protein
MTPKNFADFSSLNRFFIITLYEKVTVIVKLIIGFLTDDIIALKVK